MLFQHQMTKENHPPPLSSPSPSAAVTNTTPYQRQAPPQRHNNNDCFYINDYDLKQVLDPVPADPTNNETSLDDSYFSKPHTRLALHRTNQTLHLVRIYPLQVLTENPKLRLQIEREVTILRYLQKAKSKSTSVAAATGLKSPTIGEIPSANTENSFYHSTSSSCHSHIIHFQEILFSPQHLFIIFEYCVGGELFEVVENYNKSSSGGGGANSLNTSTSSGISQKSTSAGSSGLPYPAIKRIMRELLTTVHFLHCQGVCHRDIKLETIFLDDNNHLKLGGFGMAAVMTANERPPSSASSSSVSGGGAVGDDGVNLLTVSCGSKHYACPEIVDGVAYDGRLADIWSCGVVLFALATGTLPFEDGGGVDLFEKVCNADFFVPGHPLLKQNFSSEDPIVDFIRGMLHPNPKERYRMEYLLQHPFWESNAPTGGSRPTSSSASGKRSTPPPRPVSSGKSKQRPSSGGGGKTKPEWQK